jgi:FdhE protein
MIPERHAWLDAHPFLEPIARFQRAVERAAACAPASALPSPRWEAYAADRALGVPLLASGAAGVEWADAGATALRAIAEAVADDASGPLGERCRALRRELRERPVLAAEAIAWIAAPAREPPSADPGLLRLLAWAALRTALAPALRDAPPWHDEEGWGRGRCPTCGALPVCAQLAAGEAARPRWLACGCCGTRWRYRRIGCPFCGSEDAGRLRILEVEGESLRIDACDECRGYLKTYTGAGDEELFLADWPTLHLDVLALARGLRRAGDSLYGLPPEPPDTERRSKP